MKRFIVLACVTAAVAAGLPAARAADVGISVEISQPGVYGRIDIGRFPQPAVIVPQPVIIAPPPVVAAPLQPIYMWVPLAHRKNWARYCRQYNACGYPVYFVRHDWYNQHVRGDGRPRDPGKGYAKGHGKGHGKK